MPRISPQRTPSAAQGPPGPVERSAQGRTAVLPFKGLRLFPHAKRDAARPRAAVLDRRRRRPVGRGRACGEWRRVLQQFHEVIGLLLARRAAAARSAAGDFPSNRRIPLELEHLGC